MSSEWKEEKFDAPLSGSALLKLMRENKVKLSDISISARHVQYFEDWEEDHIIVRWKAPKSSEPQWRKDMEDEDAES